MISVSYSNYIARHTEAGTQKLGTNADLSVFVCFVRRKTPRIALNVYYAALLYKI